jgi:hypothetical protein
MDNTGNQFIQLKHSIDNVSSYTDGVIENLERIIKIVTIHTDEETNDENKKYFTREQLSYLIEMRKAYAKNVAVMKFLKAKTNAVLENECNHNFVTDYIDINPEQTIRICYCEACEMKYKDKETS